MTEPADDQAALLEALIRHRVDFVVVGGVAAQIHGWQGATADLDIAVSTGAANVGRLNAALVEVAAGPGVPGALGTVFQTRHGRLEIVRRADGIGEYSAWLANAGEQRVREGLVVSPGPDRERRAEIWRRARPGCRGHCCNRSRRTAHLPRQPAWPAAGGRHCAPHLGRGRSTGTRLPPAMVHLRH